MANQGGNPPSSGGPGPLNPNPYPNPNPPGTPAEQPNDPNPTDEIEGE